MTLTHGLSKSAEYRSYMAARNRCVNPKNNRYAIYGGRGIKMLITFEEFYAELGPKPTPEHSVDRKDTNGDYAIGNIRWATDDEQRANKRDLPSPFRGKPRSGLVRLRIQQSKAEGKKRSRRGSSQYVGVSWSKEKRKWLASITINGKFRHLGYFDDEVVAARAYDKAARDYFGLQATCNFTS